MTTTGPGDGGAMNGVVSSGSPTASALPTDPAPGPIAARIGSDEATARASTMSA